MKNILTILSLFCLCSCASVTGPSRQQVHINSEPQGANIFVDGRTLTTPAVVTLKGSSQYYVRATKEGYNEANDVVGSQVRILPAVVGNFFNLTGLVGIAIDFLATGAAYDLDDELTLTLIKK